MRLLYRGPGGVQIKYYNDKNNQKLLGTFTNVKDGDILTIDARLSGEKKFNQDINLQVVSPGIEIASIPAGNGAQIVSSTYNNFSVLSVLAYNSEKYPVTTECSVCDVAQNWIVGGNVITDLCNRLGSKNKYDLTFITDNTDRMRINKTGDVSVINSTESSSLTTGAFIVNGGAAVTKNLNVGGAAAFGSVSVSNGISAKSIDIANDNADFIATITNTNEGDGDGLKIKLGRVHPLWNGSSYERITAEDYNTVYGAFQDQINVVDGWIKNKKVDISAGDLWSLVKNTGAFLGGALCQLTNAISPALNEKIGLPFDLATPINNQLKLPLNVSKHVNDGIGLPFDLSKPINTGLNLPVEFSILTALDAAFDVLIPDSKLPGPTTTLVPKLPSLSIPAIPDLILPAIPKVALTIPAIPQIDCSALPTISMPNIKTTSVTNSLTNKNEFIRFADKDERVVGMIRVRSIGDYSTYLSSKEYLFNLVAAVGGIDISRSLLNLGKEFKNLNFNYNKLGVEYISGNGDYAEWMERKDLNEAISAGDIVGVRGGKITKDLFGAEQIMAVSTAPIVNANMPNEGRVGLGNSIAFMGQIPVKIIGEVTTGDFIVARGDIPGYGVAIKSSEMTTEDFRLVVGRAWETMKTNGPKMVNTLVGIQNNDFLKIIQKYQDKVINAEIRVTSIEERLSAIERKLSMNSSSAKKQKK